MREAFLVAKAKILNRQKHKARLAKIPKAVKDAVAKQLLDEVDGFVDAAKRAAPVDYKSEDPGAFRDSIRAYRNPDKALSYRIIVDAKDRDGRPIAAHVEHGHRAVDGTHVAAQPSFFPTYRARRKGMKRRIAAKGRKAARETYGV